VILVRRGFGWRRFAARNKTIALYFGYLAIGVLWSEYPLVAAKAWIKDVGNLVMVLVVVSEAQPKEAAKALIVRAGYILVPASILIGRYFPDLACTTIERGTSITVVSPRTRIFWA